MFTKTLLILAISVVVIAWNYSYWRSHGEREDQDDQPFSF